MKHRQKLLQKLFFVAVGCITVFLVFFALRFFNLKSLPIFVDEAIYSLWAQQGKYDPSLRLLSLVDGKQPLYIWLITITMNLISNPVVAGRIVSLITGALTLIGLYFLTAQLFQNRKAAVIASIFYVFYPFSVLLNRMAVYESTVGMFFVWSLYLTVLLLRNLSTNVSFVLGFFIGGGVLTKSTGFISIYLLPLSILLYTGKLPRLFIKWVPKVLISISIALLMYCILFLSKDYSMISQKNAIFIYHFGELIPYHAFAHWGGNIILLIGWVISFFTVPSILFVPFCFLGKFKREKLFLLLYFLLPIIGLGLLGRLLDPRYVYPFSLALIPLFAIGVLELRHYLKNIAAYTLVIAIVFGFLFYSDYKILTNITNAPIPQTMIDQLANTASSGDGLKDIINYLQNQAKTKHIVIVTEGTYGSLTTTVMQIYFMNNTLVSRYVLDPIPNQLPVDILLNSKKVDEYLILNQTQKVPYWSMNLIMEHKKGSGNQYIRLFKIY